MFLLLLVPPFHPSPAFIPSWSHELCSVITKLPSIGLIRIHYREQRKGLSSVLASCLTKLNMLMLILQDPDTGDARAHQRAQRVLAAVGGGRSSPEFEDFSTGAEGETRSWRRLGRGPARLKIPGEQGVRGAPPGGVGLSRGRPERWRHGGAAAVVFGLRREKGETERWRREREEMVGLWFSGKALWRGMGVGRGAARRGPGPRQGKASTLLSCLGKTTTRRAAYRFAAGQTREKRWAARWAWAEREKEGRGNWAAPGDKEKGHKREGA
jgi:hypothetical protein